MPATGSGGGVVDPWTLQRRAAPVLRASAAPGAPAPLVAAPEVVIGVGMLALMTLGAILHQARRAAVRALRLAVDEQEAIFESSLVGIMVLENRVITKVNRRMAEMLGYEPEELVGKGPMPLHLCEHNFHEFGEKYYWRLGQRELVDIEYPLRHKDGRTIWCRFNGKAIAPPDLGKGAVWVIEDISERRRMQEQLTHSHDTLKTILSRSPFGVMVIGRDRIIRWANDYACACAGVARPEALCGRRCHDHLCAVAARDCPILDHHQQIDNSKRVIRRSDGAEIPILKTVTPIELDGEDVLLETFVDISDLEETETALKEACDGLAGSLAFTQALLSSLPTPVFVKDREGRYLDCNRAFTEQHGITAEEIRGKTVEEIWPDEHAAVHQQMDLDLLRSAQPQEYVTKLRTPDGEDRDVLFIKNVYRNREDEIAGIIGAYVDITERRKMERELQASESRMRAITESAQDAIVMMDPAGRISFWNPAAERLFGYAREDVLGRDLHERLAPARYQEAHFAALGRFQQTGRGDAVDRTVELEALRKDGTEVPIELSMSSFKLDDGWHAVGIVRDITDRRRAEWELRKRARELNCLHELSKIVDRQPTTIQELLQEAVRLLPLAMQHPDQAMARITWDDRCFIAGVFHAARWRLAQPIRVSGRNEGLVEMAYGHDHQPARDEPFLREERALLHTLAERLGQIIEHTRAEQDLRKLSRAVEQSSMSMVVTDVEGRIEYVNPAFTEITGYEAEEVLGRNPRIVQSGLTALRVYEEMWRALQRGEDWRGELQNRKKNGELYWELAVISPVLNEQAECTHYVAVKEDITERKRLEAELRFAAENDRLTGLANRALFMDRLKRAVIRARRVGGYHFALLFLDADRFKVVNDSLGHEAGDALIRQLGQRIVECLRDVDSVSRPDNRCMVGRLGGDEFVVLLDGLDKPADAEGVARRLLANLARPYHIAGHEIVSTVSMGVVTSDVSSESAETILRDADTAMYEAKAAGKGCYVRFDVAMRDRAEERLRIETELRLAVQRGELMLLYQPIVDLVTGELESVEALVRWRHPRHGVLAPDAFVPVAEETGLIVPIGSWVLQEACRQHGVWRESMGNSAPKSVSVNLARRQLLRPNLVAEIGEMLKATGTAPRRLHVEITEREIMADVDAATHMTQALRELGVQIAMDDFGTGHSSLAALHQLNIDVLKMDRGFVANMVCGRECAALAQTIIDLARNLDISVVAEGIETSEQLMTLQAMDCRYGQGFLFSRPLPPVKIPTFRMAIEQLSMKTSA